MFLTHTVDTVWCTEMPQEELAGQREIQLWGWDVLQGWEWYAHGRKKAGTSSPGLGATGTGRITTPQPPLLTKDTKQCWKSNSPLHCPQPRWGRNFQVTSVTKGSVFLGCFQTPLSQYMDFLWTAVSFFQCSHRLEIICLGSLMIISYWVCESHRLASVSWLNECNS